MRDLTPAFKSHIQSETTTLCYCWQLTRKDEIVLGFTNHDQDLNIDGILYHAGSGFSPADFDARLGFALDNSALSGVLSSDLITSADVRAGLYDGAALTVWHVNWQDPSMRVKIWRGFIGEITARDGSFEAELVGQAVILERSTGRVFSRLCDASFCDAQCGLDINDFPSGTTCPRTVSACRDFANADNFRGFPYLIGEDAAYAAPQEGEVMDGGSRYSQS